MIAQSVRKSLYLCLTITAAAAFAVPEAPAKVNGWLNWRGPFQNGTSTETGLPDTWQPGDDSTLWTYEIKGRGAPVIADGRVYVFGYRGEGQDLREYLVCLDEMTGEPLWEHGFNDFLSDIVYDRYGIGSPAVDPETGNVYLKTTAGDFVCFTRDGEMLWMISMMEKFGQLTFPNGRTGAPVIDGDLAIIQGITSNWGAEGPARNRYYAFDKRTGELVWSSTPGVAPKDSSFSTPVFEWRDGRRLFYSGTGCGNVVCVDARTGQPVWRYQLSLGGVNSSVLLHGGDKVIAIHGKENIDSTEVGRMVAIQLGAEPPRESVAPVVLERDSELWRAPLMMFTSSPTLVGGRVYQVVHTGELVCVDANTGAILWQKKLAADQLHSSPLYADGKLYIGMWNGTFYIIKPGEDGAEILSEAKLDAGVIGSPVVWNGKIYVHSMDRLYCFGKKEGENLPEWPDAESGFEYESEPSQLRIVPAEVLLRQGEQVSFDISVLDQKGAVIRENVNDVSWESYVPPTARVQARMDASFNGEGVLAAPEDAKISAGSFKAAAEGGVSGTIRGRVLSGYPYNEDFESFELAMNHEHEQGVLFAYPPLPWIGARFKWEVRDLDGEKVLAKTLDNVLFQRAISFIGDPDKSNYTIEADVMTDGNRRMMSNVGVINQRYIVSLVGNWQQLEVSSNHNRIKVAVPFQIRPKTWYRIKSRVDMNGDGSGVVRAKAWERGADEPGEWTIEVPHKNAHQRGAPGLFGFSPQSRFRVYIDNVSVTENE